MAAAACVVVPVSVPVDRPGGWFPPVPCPVPVPVSPCPGVEGPPGFSAAPVPVPGAPPVPPWPVPPWPVPVSPVP
ncbi:hypothetical protein CXF43_09915 [Corynebacterium bovis]|nr:hypothetical protein CXF40_09460 [Corynebacterium bovis]RRQ06118.1 hypothetical protein CXF43_09915 [Corynebacterium bovis]RRQ09115.1 hypothetical protein CXF44_09240 [Corynebacterium bovis]